MYKNVMKCITCWWSVQVYERWGYGNDAYNGYMNEVHVIKNEWASNGKMNEPVMAIWMSQ